jgi:5'-methylthioadenosine phosphorylase
MAKVGLIGGTGLEQALVEEGEGTQTVVDTPFGPPSCPIVETNWHGCDIAILSRHGEGHVIPPGSINFRANIYALKSLGCTHIIASGAVGSLREDIAPKHLVIPDQVIDKTTRRIQTFYDDAAVHVHFATPFCPILRWHLYKCRDAVQTTVHEGGTYVCMEGPAFSTRAESEMHRQWGAHLIGMTVMPEAKLAREAEMAYALVAIATDYDCWKPPREDLDAHELIEEIMGNLKDATRSAVALIRAAIERFDEIVEMPSPAHSALELAIFSDKSMIPEDVKSKLGLLLDRYL